MRKIKTREEFPKLFEEHNVLGVGAEIGVMYGTFSRFILAEYTGKLILVDNWKWGGYRQALQLLDENPNVIMRQMDSIEAARTTEDASLDFVYIDADHTYQGCLLDIVAWESKVRKGGIISGHDFCNHPDQLMRVKDAVERYYGVGNFLITDQKPECYQPFPERIYNSWYLEKTWDN